MKINIKKKIGNAVVEIDIDERDDKTALTKALVFTEPDYCGLCKSQNVIWKQNKAKGEKGELFMYIKRLCLNCGATSTLGEYLPSGTGFFWKKWERYQKKSKPVNEGNEEIEDELPEIEGEKIPL